MSYYHRHTLIGQAGKDIEIYHRHRGKYDGSTTDNAYYPGRPNNSWATFVRLIVKVSGATSCTINWGDAANTSTAHSLTVSGSQSQGVNNIDFYYTAESDCQPENPTADFALHIPPEKRITVVFNNPSIVYEISFNKAELTRFTSGKFQDLNLTKFSCSAQLLTNLPVFNPGFKELIAGYDVDGVANPQPGNRIPFSLVLNALSLAKSSIEALNIGTTNTGTNLSFYANDVSAQTADLRGLTALKLFYFQGNRIVKLITDSSNAALESLRCWGTFEVRPYLDTTELYISPSLKELWFGWTNASRAESLKTAIDFSTSGAIQNIDLRNCFAGNGDNNAATLADRQAAMNATINSLYQARNNHTASGTKTLNLSGNPAVSATSHTQLQDLIANYNWSITYTAP
jgi:hypothetical protein